MTKKQRVLGLQMADQKGKEIKMQSNLLGKKVFHRKKNSDQIFRERIKRFIQVSHPQKYRKYQFQETQVQPYPQERKISQLIDLQEIETDLITLSKSKENIQNDRVKGQKFQLSNRYNYHFNQRSKRQKLREAVSAEGIKSLEKEKSQQELLQQINSKMSNNQEQIIYIRSLENSNYNINILDKNLQQKKVYLKQNFNSPNRQYKLGFDQSPQLQRLQQQNRQQNVNSLKQCLSADSLIKKSQQNDLMKTNSNLQNQITLESDSQDLVKHSKYRRDLINFFHTSKRETNNDKKVKSKQIFLPPLNGKTIVPALKNVNKQQA